MSFKNWYGTLLPFEAKALTREEIFQAGAASRDAEIQRLQMALADVEALELGTAEKCNQLRAELVNALAACKAKDEAILQENYSLALSFQPDDSALKAWLGRVVAWFNPEEDMSDEAFSWDKDVSSKHTIPLYSPKELK